MLLLKITNFFSLYFQRLLGLKKLKGYPYYVVIDPANVCQLQCPFCDGRLRPRTKMSLNDFKKIIDSIGKTCINLELYNWGEPLLNNEIIEMINYASQNYKMYTRISSNLNFCNDDFYRELVLSKLNSLVISLDGASKETYEKYRVNGSFDKVINNIRLIVNYKKYFNKTEPKLVWQFLVFKHNENEMDKAKQMAKELQLNELCFAKPNIPPEFKEWDSSIAIFSDYTKSKNNEVNDSLGEKKKCYWPYSSIAINANGSVSPCCGVAKEEDDFGNIFNCSFNDIWNNDKFRSARKYVFQNTLKIDSDNVCARCDIKGLINFAPNFFQVLYYLIKPLRMTWMKFNNFKIKSS